MVRYFLKQLFNSFKETRGTKKQKKKTNFFSGCCDREPNLVLY